MKTLLIMLYTTIITNSLPSFPQSNHCLFNHYRTEEVNVEPGTSTIEVFGYGDKEKLTCEFGDAYTGKATLVERNTYHCLATTNNLSLPGRVFVRVFNMENHPITYKVFVSK